MPGQVKHLYDALAAPRDFVVFTREEAAEEHCQVWAEVYSNSMFLNWLDKMLRWPWQPWRFLLLKA